jgi:hypothetical protein
MTKAAKRPAKAPPQKASEKPLTEVDLARVAGGYIGETEKKLVKISPA